MVSITATRPPMPGLAANLGVSLKRKHMDLQNENPTTGDGPVKRQKVAFDPDVEIRIMEDWSEKSLELVREEVRRGIERHYAGDNAGYDQLKQLFATKSFEEDAPSTSLLQKYVVALTGCTSMLNKNCSGLVHAVLDCEWLGRDEQFVALYTRLMGSLVSAHGGYTGAVLKMLVNYFVELPGSTGRLPNHTIVRRPQLYTRVHQVLKYILRLIPSASGVLSSILSASFPFSTDTARAHVSYSKNLLRLTEYAPELKGEILALITERLVKIDVQIQVDMEDLEEDVEESLVQEVLGKQTREDRDAEDVSDDSDNESSSSEESTDPDERRIRDLKASVTKMDNILDLLFEFYHPIFAKGNVFEVEDTFTHLLSQFANTILPTYRSRHTQFILFHFGQVSPSLIQRFVETCGSLAFDKTRPHIMRLAAATYLASFIARGAHVSAHMVRDVLTILGDHLEDLRRTHEITCVGPDLRRYGGYYAIAQALLYIFCFRWRDLIVSDGFEEDDDDDLLSEGRDFVWMAGIRELLTRNIYSKLNPLKVCSPAIVTQFARIAHHLRFLYVFPLLETNKRLRLSRSAALAAMYQSMPERETALSGKKGESAFQLDAYFPFDPYHLPRSKRWIEGDYNEWKAIPGLDDEPGEESESESGDDAGGEDEEDVDEETGTDEE